MVMATAMLFGALWVGAGTPAHAGGSCSHPASMKGGLDVDLRENCFNPTVLRVAPGTTVTWTNREAVDHTVTGLGVTWGVADPLHEGDSVTFRFTKPGIYPYECVIHYGMVGAVVVGDGALGAVSAYVAPEQLPAAQAPAQASPVVKIVRVASKPAAAVSGGPWRTAAVVGWAVAAAMALGFAVVRLRRPAPTG
jgi:plastocyanin